MENKEKGLSALNFLYLFIKQNPKVYDMEAMRKTTHRDHKEVFKIL